MNRAGIIIMVLILCRTGAGSLEKNAEAPPAALNKSGLDYLNRGEYEKAESCFKKAASMDRGNKYYCNNLAASCMRQGKFNEAYGYLSRCIALDVNYARALSNMAVTAFRLHKYRESYDYYLRSISADSGYTAVRFEKGRVMAMLRELLKDNPENSEYRDLLIILENGGRAD